MVVAFVTLVSVRGEEVAEWVFYLPLPFLGVLLLTGLYLFALPYLAKRRGQASPAGFSSGTDTSGSRSGPS